MSNPRLIAAQCAPYMTQAAESPLTRATRWQAAAPEMLAALRLCEAYLAAQRGLSPKGIRALAAARAAIWKATDAQRPEPAA